MFAAIMCWIFRTIFCTCIILAKFPIAFVSWAKDVFLYNKAKSNYFLIQSGNSCNTDREILNYLHKRIPGLKEVQSVKESDVILVFCPIVSRAGTDMEAALNRLNICSASKPAVFMVLHHTFEREKILPDSSGFIKRGNTLTVNCLFNEDEKLMKCDMNYEALDKIIRHLKQGTEGYGKRDADEGGNV